MCVIYRAQHNGAAVYFCCLGPAYHLCWNPPGLDNHTIHRDMYGWLHLLVSEKTVRGSSLFNNAHICSGVSSPHKTTCLISLYLSSSSGTTCNTCGLQVAKDPVQRFPGVATQYYVASSFRDASGAACRERMFGHPCAVCDFFTCS